MAREWKKSAVLGVGLVLGALTLPAAAGAGPWRGLYVGGHGGYLWADVNGFYDTAEAAGQPTPLNVMDFDGGLFGVHLGYNLQKGRLVFGVEGDLTGADVEETTASLEPVGPGPDNIVTDIGRLGSIRARLGLAAGASQQLLFYVTGGYGIGEFNINAVNALNGTHGALNLDGDGAVYGAGLELGKGDGRLRFRVEYLHYDVGTSSSLFIPPFTNNTDVDPGDSIRFGDVDLVRVGVSFKIGHHRPPPEPYKK